MTWKPHECMRVRVSVRMLGCVYVSVCLRVRVCVHACICVYNTVCSVCSWNRWQAEMSGKELLLLIGVRACGEMEIKMGFEVKSLLTRQCLFVMMHKIGANS